jgi:hyperosmotically inducible periplasmic protein
MRRLALVVTSALFGVVGCAHERAGTSESGYAQAKNDFGAAYDSVKSGAKSTATAGKLAFKGIGAGAVQVKDQTKSVASRTGSKISDGWITTKVKTELATTKGVSSGDVHVDTDAGIVRLSGTVDSPHEAQRAIETALKVKGVDAVDSQLQYPTERVRSRFVTPSTKDY